jgi:hypothetical protein
MKTLFVILLSISFLQGCDYNEIKSVPVSGGNSLLTTPEATIDFELIQTQTAVCLNCHSAGGRQPELTSKQDFIDNMADVLSEVLGDTMPPVKKGFALFTPCQKAALQKWYDLGSSDESTTPVSSLPECIVSN